MVFQSYNLLPYMTALQNVLTAMEISGVKGKNRRQQALEIIQRVGLTEQQAHQKVLTLGGGQQQRVAVARALSTDTELIIADEPTGNLDEHTANEIVVLFKNLAHQENKCVLMVTHDLEIAQNSDVISKLHHGQLAVDRKMIA